MQAVHVLQAEGVALLGLHATQLGSSEDAFIYAFLKMDEGSIVRLPDNSFGEGGLAFLTPSGETPGRSLMKPAGNQLLDQSS